MDPIAEIKQGKISPVYLLHGEEAYLIEDTVSDMIDTLVPKNVRDFNLDVFSNSNVSIDEILSIADTYPVMADRRVVVVKNPAFLGSKKEIDLFEIFRESVELYHAGNLSRSSALLARALNLELEEFAEGGNIFRRAIETFKTDNEDKLSADDIEFLNDNADTLAKEFDIFSMPVPQSGVDRLLEWIQNQSAANTVLILAVNSALNSNDKIVKTISRVGKVIYFSRFKPSSYISHDPMYKMVSSRLKEYKKSIAPDAFFELQKKTGNDMRQIFDELDKLVTFIGNRQQIEKADVEDLVTKSDFDRIFDLTNAVGQRSLKLALANLKSILGKGDHPVLIHSMLARQIRLILQVKILLEKGDLKQNMGQMNYDAFRQQVNLSSELINELPDSKQSNVLKQTYPLYISLQHAKNFTTLELVKAMERLLEADIQLKTGILTPELVVEMLVMDLCSPSERLKA